MRIKKNKRQAPDADPCAHCCCVANPTGPARTTSPSRKKMATKIERMEELVRQKEAFLFEKQTQAREAEQGLAAVQAKADGTEERLLVRSLPTMPLDDMSPRLT